MDSRDQDLTANTTSQWIRTVPVPFPIAFLVMALLTDLLFWSVGASMWATASLWLLGAVAIAAPIAALAVISERRNASWHKISTLLVLGLALLNWYPRYELGPEAGMHLWGIGLSLASVLLLLFNGWRKWELMYRHPSGAVTDPRP